MVVKRLLIADASDVFGKCIAKQLKNEFIIKVCDDGERALEMIRKFDPDLLLIDLELPHMDGISILHAMRATGLHMKVVAISTLTDDYICAQLNGLQVTNLYRKPCSLGAVISSLREIAHMDDMQADDWCAEDELDRILLDLNIEIGRGSYPIVCAAVLYWCENPYCSMTKCLYPALAKQFNGTLKQVEKAIRDAVKIAWERGNRQMWCFYFPPSDREGYDSHPSNEVFLARIAKILMQKKRPKKPLDFAEEIAQ